MKKGFAKSPLSELAVFEIDRKFLDEPKIGQFLNRFLTAWLVDLTGLEPYGNDSKVFIRFLIIYLFLLIVVFICDPTRQALLHKTKKVLSIKLIWE